MYFSIHISTLVLQVTFELFDGNNTQVLKLIQNWIVFVKHTAAFDTSWSKLMHGISIQNTVIIWPNFPLISFAITACCLITICYSGQGMTLLQEQKYERKLRVGEPNEKSSRSALTLKYPTMREPLSFSW